MVEEGELRQIVGVDYSRLYAELERQARRHLLEQVDAAIAQCRASIAALMDTTARLQTIVNSYEQALRALKAELRMSAG